MGFCHIVKFMSGLCWVSVCHFVKFVLGFCHIVKFMSGLCWLCVGLVLGSCPIFIWFCWHGSGLISSFCTFILQALTQNSSWSWTYLEVTISNITLMLYFYLVGPISKLISILNIHTRFDLENHPDHVRSYWVACRNST